MSMVRTARVNVRFLHADRETIERAARAANQRISDFIRSELLAASQRRLARAEPQLQHEAGQ